MYPCILTWIFFFLVLGILFFIVYKYKKTIIRNKELEGALDYMNNNLYYSQSDVQGVIVDVSHALCELTGYTKEELVGRNHSIFKHQNTQNGFVRELWATIKDGSTWEGEMQNLKKDGTSYWQHIRIIPIFDKNSKITGYKAFREDITAKKHMEELAITDKLTKIHNRVYLDDMYEKEFYRAKRYQQIFSVVMIDMDNFKNINDTYGHLTGDKALVRMAKVIEKNIRETDYLGRWGGEEFLIICPNTFVAQALIVGEKVHNAVLNMEFEDIPSQTCSIGISEYQVDDSMNEAIIRADKAMYMAKDSGKNRVCVF